MARTFGKYKICPTCPIGLLEATNGFELSHKAVNHRPQAKPPIATAYKSQFSAFFMTTICPILFSFFPLFLLLVNNEMVEIERGDYFDIEKLGFIIVLAK